MEAYRCSGLNESLRFDRIPKGLGSTPTLSAITRTDHEVTALVTLSYLAHAGVAREATGCASGE